MLRSPMGLSNMYYSIQVVVEKVYTKQELHEIHTEKQEPITVDPSPNSNLEAQKGYEQNECNECDNDSFSNGDHCDSSHNACGHGDHQNGQLLYQYIQQNPNEMYQNSSEQQHYPDEQQHYPDEQQHYPDEQHHYLDEQQHYLDEQQYYPDKQQYYSDEQQHYSDEQQHYYLNELGQFQSEQQSYTDEQQQHYESQFHHNYQQSSDLTQPNEAQYQYSNDHHPADYDTSNFSRVDPYLADNYPSTNDNYQQLKNQAYSDNLYHNTG